MSPPVAVRSMLCDCRSATRRQHSRVLKQGACAASTPLLLRSSLRQLLEGIHMRVTRDMLRYNNVTLLLARYERQRVDFNRYPAAAGRTMPPSSMADGPTVLLSD